MQCSMTGEPLTEGGDQTEVIDFLSDPDSYPGNLERINRLETQAPHIPLRAPLYCGVS